MAFVVKGKIYSEGKQIDYHSFIDNLRTSDAQNFFMKPENGQGGKGILRIEKNKGDFLINNKIVTKESFDEILSRQDYLIQEGIVQRKDMMEIYPHSVNTLRVVTQNFNGDPHISAITLRMGRNGTFVDNSSSGGLSSYLDMKTGRIAEYAIDHDFSKKFDHHPDTGFVFKGFEISDWEKIKKSILDLARKTSDFPDIGWDIGIVEGGIVVIEMNLNWGIDMQGVVGGMRRVLNIDPFIAPRKTLVK